YARLFENGCGGSDSAPGCDTDPGVCWEVSLSDREHNTQKPNSLVSTAGVKHAYRRGDSSGTTDTFLSLLNAPASGTTPFCNGAEKEDKAPIRRMCDQTEQVCEADGTLGLVLPIVVPTSSSDRNVLYNAEQRARQGVVFAQPTKCTATTVMFTQVQPPG